MEFTPTQKRAAAWLGIAVLAVLVLRLLGPVLTPFVVGAVLAYALTPLVDRLDALGRGRVPRVVSVIAWLRLRNVREWRVTVPNRGPSQEPDAGRSLAG